MNAHTCTKPSAPAPVIEADRVKWVIGRIQEGFGDIASSLRLCERHVLLATEDHGMEEATSTGLRQLASTLMALTRAIEWELHDVDHLAMQVDKVIEGASS